jgi:type VI secretion system protein ImpL
VLFRSPYEAQPLLRGLYFVSGTQEGTPIDHMLGSISRQYQIEKAVLPPQQASGRSYFLSRLLTDVVFAEQGLAGTNLSWERKRSALVVAAYAGIGLLSVGAISAWIVSYGNNKKYVEAVAQRVEAVRELVRVTPNRHEANLIPIVGALEATRGLAATGGASPDGSVPWSFGFGLYQGRKLDMAARTAYDRMLIDAMLPRLALRVENQLASGSQQESQYEALKAYLMMYEPEHFDAGALKAHFESDWDASIGREISAEQRDQLSLHLDSLLAQGAAVSPLAQDKGLIDRTRLQLATVSLPQRVYNRLRQRGLGADFPEFTVAKAGGGNAPLVFTRVSGLPLTKGVPGLFSFNGYHKGFQQVVGEVTRQLDAEQDWVLGIKSPPKSAGAVISDKLVDDVRRVYLNEYAATWEAFIADVRLVPVTSIAQSVQTTRILAAPDTPLVPLLKAMSRETTLLTGSGSASIDQAAEAAKGALQKQLLGKIGLRAPTTGAPEARIESIVDDRFIGLRRLVTAPDGGKAPIEGVVSRLGELQVLLTAVDTALKGGSAPPASPLPNQLKAEAANSPEPVRSLLDNLGSASAKVAQMQLRESLAREVRATIGEFCQAAVAGRYPFDPGSTRDVTQADFAALFGPGGKFDQMTQKLAPYIDTSTRPWTFRAVDGTPLGTDHGTLPQFQRAAAIRETFFPPGGPGLSLKLEFKPVDMDPGLSQFVLDADGQVVRYSHGPQIPATVQWPGPRGSGQVRVMVTPSGPTGLVNDGPWALLRLFERVNIQPTAAPEKFKAVFDLDGRKTTFDVTTSSVRNPFRMQELRQFACPAGL